MTNGDSKGPIIGDLIGAGQIINSDVVKQTYDDALSPTMRELGDVSVDTLKAFRLFTAPIQLMAAYQDRFRDFCDRVRNKVPEDQQREAPAEIARPVMEAFTSTSDDSPLMSMFEELMAKAIDKREANKLSPSFPQIIRNLSPLEAKLIAALKKRPQTTDDLYKADINMIVQRIHANFKFTDFGGSEHHLTIAQSLLDKKIVNIRSSNINKGTSHPSLEISNGQKLKRTTIELTMFGRWFAAACVG